jgi:hypothetical protein
MEDEQTSEATQQTDWRTSLPETVQQWDEVKQAETPDVFFDQMSNMRSLIGRSLQVPGEDASSESRTKFVQKVLAKAPELILKPNEDNMADFYNSLGRPEAADKYLPPELEGVYFDKNSLEAFAPIAYDSGLSNKQFQQIVGAMQKNQIQAQQQFESERGEGMQGLKGEWGMAFDNHLAAAQEYVNKLLPSIGDVNNLPASAIKELYDASRSIGAEGAQLTQESGASAVMTPAEAQEKIDEILGNQEHAYWHPSNPAHKAAVDKVIKLHEFKAS